jgi:hypothetical protein
MCCVVCHGIAWNSNRKSSPEPGDRQVCRTRSLSSDARSARRGIDSSWSHPAAILLVSGGARREKMRRAKFWDPSGVTSWLASEFIPRPPSRVAKRPAFKPTR